MLDGFRDQGRARACKTQWCHRPSNARLSGVTNIWEIEKHFENYGKLSGVIHAIFQILVVFNTNNTIGSYAPEWPSFPRSPAGSLYACSTVF